jgi:acyl-CoA thioesterase-1
MMARRWSLAFLVLLLASVPLRAAERPLLVCYGDSITAGLGLPYGKTYPDDLQRMLDQAGYHYRVVNRGTSGATTKDAVAGLPYLLRMHPAVAIVEFGGNDGLRGLPIADTRANLDKVLTTLQGAHIRVLLAGITLPPDYGPDYIRQFQDMYRQLAAKDHVVLLPMLYIKLIGVPGTIQRDGIHPTEKGAVLIAETLVPALKPLLKK